MPGPDDLTRRLDALLDDLLGDRPLEAASILSKISRMLAPDDHAAAQGRIARRLKAVAAFSAETAVKAACVMHLSGVPPHRLVHFLSASLPGSLTLSQFELAVRFIFNDDPPVSPQLLYDITQYTYLEKKLLSRRSVELASRLKGSLTPQVLLYLYLLSLRDDLSNENVHLILLILHICFPALKVRVRAREISAAEQREVAAAWKNAQRSARYDRILPAAASESADARLPRESASYFLDKYFSDAGASAQQTGATKEAARPVTRRLTFTRSSARGGVPRTPRPGPKERAQGQPRPRRSPDRTMSRSAKQEAAPTAPAAAAEAPHVAAEAPAAAAEAPPAAGRGSALLVGPFLLAALLVVLGVSLSLRQTSVLHPQRTTVSVEQPPGAQTPAGQPPGATTPGATTPAAAQTGPALQTRVVQKGDSLWKIYRSLRGDGTAAVEWQEFLKTMKQKNDLPDPDRIYPGNVLSITTEDK
jgi:LysM domain